MRDASRRCPKATKTLISRKGRDVAATSISRCEVRVWWGSGADTARRPGQGGSKSGSKEIWESPDVAEQDLTRESSRMRKSTRGTRSVKGQLGIATAKTRQRASTPGLLCGGREGDKGRLGSSKDHVDCETAVEREVRRERKRRGGEEEREKREGERRVGEGAGKVGTKNCGGSGEEMLMQKTIGSIDGWRLIGWMMYLAEAWLWRC